MFAGSINKTTEYDWTSSPGIFCSSHGTAVPCIPKKDFRQPKTGSPEAEIFILFHCPLDGEQFTSKDPCLFSGEMIFGNAVIPLAGLGEGLHPLGVIHRVGIELGLQGDTATVAVGNTILALIPFQEVAAVELNTNAVGVHAHGTAQGLQNTSQLWS